MTVKQFFEIFQNQDHEPYSDGDAYINIMHHGECPIACGCYNVHAYDDYKIITVRPFANDFGDILFDIYVEGEDYED